MAPDDFEDRELCPDELCTGIIGDDGRCGTCGRMREGAAPPKRKAAFDAFDHDVEVESGEEEEDRDVGGFEEADGRAGYDPDERIPCPDELCTGIIGQDGRCGTCGRRA